MWTATPHSEICRCNFQQKSAMTSSLKAPGLHRLSLLAIFPRYNAFLAAKSPIKPILCCRTIGRVDQTANLLLDRKSDKTVFASPHDLRHSFGLRCLRRAMPAVLQELMRHESIETTIKFNVGQDPQSTAAEFHRAFADTSNEDQQDHFDGNPAPINEKRTHVKLT
jgi:hypothetical protein